MPPDTGARLPLRQVVDRLAKWASSRNMRSGALLENDSQFRHPAH